MVHEQLTPFWEPGATAVFPLSQDSLFGREACAIFEDVTQAAVDAGGTGFDDETQAEWSRRVAALRTRMTCEVLGEDQRALAIRLGITPEHFSRIVNGHAAPSYRFELALFRELLHCALWTWVNAWASDEDRREFETVYLANPLDFGGYSLESGEVVRGHSVTDNFSRALYALGVVCGREGWRDFWRAVGCHVYPLSGFEGSAQHLNKRLKMARRREETAGKVTGNNQETEPGHGLPETEGEEA